MIARRWLGVGLFGVGCMGACATRSSPLGQEPDPVAGAAGAAGVAGAAGGAGAGAGTAGVAGAAGGAGAGAGTAGVAGAGATGGVGSAGSAGASGDGGTGGAGGGGQAGAGAAGAAGGGINVLEPDGPPEFRLLNGVPDVPSLKMCLVPWSGAAPAGLDSKPLPEGKELLYGEILHPSFPPGFAPENDSFRPFLLSGSLGAVGDKGCLELLEKPPEGVTVTGLPVLPGGATTAPRSRLAIAAGCVGGGAVPDVVSACGTGVDPVAGNATLVLVELSRIAPPVGQFGLQVVNASTAMPLVSMQLFPSLGGGASLLVASGVSLGKIAPRPPFSGTVADLFGENLPGARFQVNDAQNGSVLQPFEVGPTLAESEVGVDKIGPGRGAVLVLLGPRPGSPVDAAPVTPPRLRWLEAPTLAP